MFARLFTIPGLEGSEKLRRMRKESQQRMRDAARSQAIAAAIMSQRYKRSCPPSQGDSDRLT